MPAQPCVASCSLTLACPQFQQDGKHGKAKHTQSLASLGRLHTPAKGMFVIIERCISLSMNTRNKSYRRQPSQGIASICLFSVKVLGSRMEGYIMKQILKTDIIRVFCVTAWGYILSLKIKMLQLIKNLHKETTSTAVWKAKMMLLQYQ